MIQRNATCRHAQASSFLARRLRAIVDDRTMTTLTKYARVIHLTRDLPEPVRTALWRDMESRMARAA